MTKTAASLFSGIGSFELACELHGIQNVYACDNNIFSKVHFSVKHPNTIFYDDITTLIDAPHVDLLTFGSPCQDASNAAAQKNDNPLTAARSGLFYEATRVIRQSKPRFVIFENVAAMRTKSGREIISEFNSCGYDTDESILTASQFGAQHERKRWFVLCRISDTDSVGRHQNSGFFGRVIEKGTKKKGYRGESIQSEFPRDVLRRNWTEANRGGIDADDGLSERILLGHLAKAIGNSIDARVAQAIIKTLKEQYG